MGKEALKKVFVWTVMFVFILNGRVYITDEVQPKAAAAAGTVSVSGSKVEIIDPFEELCREGEIKAGLCSLAGQDLGRPSADHRKDTVKVSLKARRLPPLETGKSTDFIVIDSNVKK